ncbi:MAG TPA: SPFH domain-containing protein, partial [Candidatus Deferrimicrobium sp.]|nr:SPFH domain-containing protein [Candidatus Deferrimicrobium sp.]
MLVLIIGIILGGIAVGTMYSRMNGPKPDSRKVGKLVVVILVIVVIISLASQMFVIIEAGTVGVVKRLGAVTDELHPGLHLLIPVVDQVVVLPTIKMTYEATDKPEQSKANYPDVIISALTSDGQQIRVGITARFMIQPGKAA